MNGPSQFRRSFVASLGATALSAVLPVARAKADSEPARAARAAAWLAVDLLGTDGREMSLGQIAAPVVVVHVWASWCPACVGELASIQAVMDQLGPAGHRNAAREPSQALGQGCGLPAADSSAVAGLHACAGRAVGDARGGVRHDGQHVFGPSHPCVRRADTALRPREGWAGGLAISRRRGPVENPGQGRLAVAPGYRQLARKNRGNSSADGLKARSFTMA